MTVPIKVECPKCHGDRTMLEATFGVPGYIEPAPQKDSANINVACAVPVRLILCSRCHYLEMYHDVGLGNLDRC